MSDASVILDEEPAYSFFHDATCIYSYAYLYSILFPKGFVAIPHPTGGQGLCPGLGKASAAFTEAFSYF